MIFKPEMSGITVKIAHADITRFLDVCISTGIAMKRISMVDEITVIMTVDRTYQDLLASLCEKNNAQIETIDRQGIYWKIKMILAHPALLAGIAVMLLLSAAIPRLTLMIRVEGNGTVPDSQILEAAEEAGIYFGASRKKIRSEQVKNHLLEELPQLQWVGVNTNGCVATISVKERSTMDTTRHDAANGGIVAATDGIIRTIHTTRGNPLCVTGQAVKTGDLLVSPYTDCGLTIRVTGAEAEIYAETLRTLETVLPAAAVEKGAVTDIIKRFSLQIGKKHIKFYKDSGIYDSSCDKMYKKYYLALPGGFQLPVALVVEQLSKHEAAGIPTAQLMLAETAQKYGEDYLLQQMVAGQILSSRTRAESDGTVCRIIAEYRCLEMIGRAQQEEKILNYGKSD